MILSYLFPLTGLMIGFFTGFVFQRGRVCTNTAFRNILIIHNFEIIKIIVITVLVAIIGYQFLFSSKIFGLTFTSSPIQFSLIFLPIGSFIFGFGTVLAGGCAGGVCYRVGEGNSNALLALIGYTFGIAIYGLLGPSIKLLIPTMNWTINGNIPSLELFLPRIWWSILAFSLLTIIVLLNFHSDKSKNKSTLPYLLDSWQPIKTGFVIGILAVLARLTSALVNRQFGFSTVDGIAEILGIVPNILGIRIGASFNWAGMFIIGLIVGALVSSINIHEFKFTSPTSTNTVRFLIGGFILGFSAVMASGCNVGHIFGGIPELGISSLVAGFLMLLGNFFGSYLFYSKFKMELPSSTPIKN
ncbi:MAG: YeeE/YedE family protein [Candidatus Thorarchaeota archaeon]